MAEETILITGATGQQGGVVTRYLLQQGKKVRADAPPRQGRRIEK